MLTIIEVRIVYKTQQKKKPQLGFSINNQEKKKNEKESWDLKKTKLFQENLPHIHLHNGD